jgi:hypothetical protein
MPLIEVRSFRRSDRDQLTQLVNSHAEAVVPGMGVSVSTLLSSLERQPGEFIEDPWVQERLTLVAEQADRVAAAAHLLRYFADERAGDAARDVGEIRWLLFWPEAAAMSSARRVTGNGLHCSGDTCGDTAGVARCAPSGLGYMPRGAARNTTARSVLPAINGRTPGVRDF